MTALSGKEGPSHVRPASRDAELFNDSVFGELRARAKVPDDFVNGGWDLSTLRPGGGKGGTRMAFVGESYIVKELSKGDHATLLKITNSYGQHVKGGGTLLSPIYLHFRDIASNRFFFAMQNCIGSGPFKVMYDLKACADDKLMEHDGERVEAVHKRIWNVPMWCGKCAWNAARKRYHIGKLQARSAEIVLTAAQREVFLGALCRDAEWLASHRIMDYSLLIAEKEVLRDIANADQGRHGLSLGPFSRRGPCDGHDTLVYVAIIDFFQLWTFGKRVAQYMKILELNKATVPPKYYASRFVAHFESRVAAVKTEESPSGTCPGPSPIAPPVGDVPLAPPALDLNLQELPEKVFSVDCCVPWNTCSPGRTTLGAALPK